MVHSDSSGLNCTTYDLTGAISDKKNSCVGIGMPTGMNNNNSDENLAMEPVIVEDKKLCEFKASNQEKILTVFLIILNLKINRKF